MRLFVIASGARQSRFKFCVEGAFPFRDEVHSLSGRASSVTDIFNKSLRGKTVRDNSDCLFAEVVSEGVVIDGLNALRLKGNNGFFVTRDRLKMHSLVVAGKPGCQGSRVEDQEKNISHICLISLIPLQKEIIS